MKFMLPVLPDKCLEYIRVWTHVSLSFDKLGTVMTVGKSNEGHSLCL